MKVTVQVNQNELDEMRLNKFELRRVIAEDLDVSRDYPGFDVEVIVVDESE